MIEKIEYDTHAEWYKNGVLHREDGPAREWHDDYLKEWFLNGKCHRIGGPAIEWANGDKEWYINGKLHREDGPALEFADGEKQWWVNGELHRDGGPACERPNGAKEWWINDLWINKIKLYLTKRFSNCIGQFLYNKNRDYLIFCFECYTHYFYMVFWNKHEEKWKGDNIDGKRFDCNLEELKSLL